MTLLKEWFPKIGGLYDTSLGSTLYFPAAIGANWIQIIHSANNHYVVASLRINEKFVSIYDSMARNSQKPDKNDAGCLSPYCEPKTRHFLTLAGDASNNYLMTGIHATANAVTLALGQDPSITAYDEQTCVVTWKQALLAVKYQHFLHWQQERVKCFHSLAYCGNPRYIVCHLQCCPHGKGFWGGGGEGLTTFTSASIAFCFSSGVKPVKKPCTVCN